MNSFLKMVSIAAALGFLSACEPVTTWRPCLTSHCEWPHKTVYIDQSYYRACECTRENRVVQGLDGAMMYHD